ncbi:DNA polymerase [Lampropedia cohaerens]|uniref:DNA polymerase IV n=1 Tax=Lampropedia cohaerens TaxID=1610491 RepID=A0A0U1PZ48_9BURK|nr:DNA polymerase IV [Lampropedia cohaerens]KKW67756.1 DNA polymerase [Lampropedia cohaerens]
MSAAESRRIRRIAHLDMDAFFASVELLRQPQLRGLPLVIGGGRRAPGWLGDDALEALPPEQIPLEAFRRLGQYTGRGVVTTATYEARQYGVGSAMGMMKAAKLCPQAYLLPADFERYRAYSARFKAEILRHATVMEDRGIDEVYIDFTDAPDGQLQGGLVLAQRIQQAIAEATGLSCSLGVAPNKLLAKLASEWHKPGGIFILMPEEVTQRIWPLACRKVNGIGPKASARLAALGIETLGQLAQVPEQQLIEQFGNSYGAWLHRVAWGRDDRPVVVESEPVSMSRETTFERDLHAVADRSALSQVFTNLCTRVAADLQRKGYAGRTVGIKVRFPDFRIATRAITLDHHTQDAAEIRRVAGQCLKRVDLSRRIRLLGVKVDNLLPLEQAQAADEAARNRQASDPQQLALPFTDNP